MAASRIQLLALSFSALGVGNAYSHGIGDGQANQLQVSEKGTPGAVFTVDPNTVVVEDNGGGKYKITIDAPDVVLADSAGTRGSVNLVITTKPSTTSMHAASAVLTVGVNGQAGQAVSLPSGNVRLELA